MPTCATAHTFIHAPKRTAVRRPPRHACLSPTRQFGNRIYVDLEIAVKPDISLRDAHGIAERVHSAVEQEFPNVKHVMIHVNPEED